MPRSISASSKPAIPGIKPELTGAYEFAARANVSVPTIMKWSDEGVKGCPKYVRMGEKRLFFVAAEVDAWFAKIRAEARALAKGNTPTVL